jgi:hypothetical protein
MFENAARTGQSGARIVSLRSLLEVQNLLLKFPVIGSKILIGHF